MTQKFTPHLAKVGNKIGADSLYKFARGIRPEKPICFSDWVHKHTYLHNKPFSFSKHEYQKQILDDTHPRIAVRKSVQIGISEILVRKFIGFLGMHQGTQGIYTQPTAEEVGQFVKTRIDPVIKECPKIRELGFNVDNVKIKQIGKSFAHFRGTFGERETISVPSDFNIHDETDFSKPNIQNLYRSRMEHSSFAWEISCSTPTLPLYGIDELFEVSDQHYWHVKCPHCGRWQVLMWWPDKEREKESNIRLTDGRWDEHVQLAGGTYQISGEWIYVCRKCDREIRYDPDLVEMQWVAKYPDRKDVRGYALNALAGWGYKKPLSIVKSFFDYKEIDKAYNRILGLAYTTPGKKLSRSDILRCVNNALNMQKTGRNCFLGADQAISLVVIGNFTERGKIRVVHFEKVKGNLFDQVDKHGRTIKGRLPELMEEFDVQVGVVDAQPNTESAYQFAKNYAGRVWPCFYSDRQFEKLNWKEESQTVIANRNRTFETAMQYWQDKRVEIFPEDDYNYNIYEMFVRHLTSLTKVVDETEDGRKISRWLVPKASDFAHVWNYLCMALEADVNIITRVMEPRIEGFGMKK
jgi:hypothetical protein